MRCSPQMCGSYVGLSFFLCALPPIKDIAVSIVGFMGLSNFSHLPLNVLLPCVQFLWPLLTWWYSNAYIFIPKMVHFLSHSVSLPLAGIFFRFTVFAPHRSFLIYRFMLVVCTSLASLSSVIPSRGQKGGSNRQDLAWSLPPYWLKFPSV